MVNEDKTQQELSEDFHDDMFLTEDSQDFSSEVPEVSEGGNGGSQVMVIIVAAIIVIVVIFSLLGDEEAEKLEAAQEKAEQDKKDGKKERKLPPNRQANIGGGANIGQNLPGRAGRSNAPRQLVAPPPPPPPPPPVSAQTGENNFGGGFGIGARQGRGGGSANILDERVQSNIILLGGGGALSRGVEEDQIDNQFAEVGDTNAPQVEATISGNPEQMIFQGKVINVVLETAINTDLPGIIRGVVSRDVYAEQGRQILIPKGSRLIGSYSSDIIPGQFRVYMIWNRVILPNGIDIALESGSIDLLGRSGSQGAVDSKLFEIYSNAILQSAVTVAFAGAAAAVTNADEVEEGTTSSGDNTESGEVVDLAVVDAVDNFGSTVSGSLDTFLNLQPTITIDQGVEVKVLVARDLFFSRSLLSGSRIIR